LNTVLSHTDGTALDGIPSVGLSWPGRSLPGSWIFNLEGSECAPGVYLDGGWPDDANGKVGAGGGYGAIYCFALDP
jgi:hypothetical protein